MSMRMMPTVVPAHKPKNAPFSFIHVLRKCCSVLLMSNYISYIIIICVCVWSKNVKFDISVLWSFCKVQLNVAMAEFWATL